MYNGPKGWQMTVYWILIVYILGLPAMLRFAGYQGDKLNKKVLIGSMTALFLLAALRAPSVGRDVAGYKAVYQTIQQAPWKNFDVSYFEWGYEFLMMLSSHVLHLPFQVFIAVIYGFYYFSLYRFIRRYSADYHLSVLIYVCFNFFCFDLSAIRNMLAITVCLFAVPFAQQRGAKNMIKFLAIAVVAAQIHRSAYTFLAAYAIMKIPLNRYSLVFYGIILGILIVFRSTIVTVVDLYIKDMGNVGGSGIGGNVLVYTAIVGSALLVRYLQEKKTATMSKETVLIWYQHRDVLDFSFRMMCSAIVILGYFNGTSLIRLAQCLLMFMLVLPTIPLSWIKRNDRMLLRMGMTVLLVLYFMKYTLLNNPLDIVPYVFFW